MRKLAAVAAFATLAATSTSLAAAQPAGSPTARDVQTAMLKANNKRLALNGAAFRITRVLCIQETTSSFYCVGFLSARGGVEAGTRYVWNVSVPAPGLIKWNAPHVLPPH